MDTEAQSSTARMIGRYHVSNELGRGGMGIVYRAEDRLIGRQVAVKTLTEVTPELRERFYIEARSGILSHQNIVTVYELGEHEGSPFIAMEYVAGDSLEHILRQKKRLPLLESLAIVEQLCAGLGYAHGHGVVHRDVKPANVLVRPDGRVTIVDFGIARLADQTRQLTKTDTLLGTFHYIAPERLKGEPSDGRSDIWSAGVMLYELVTGQLPFRGSDISSLYRVLHEPYVPLAEHIGDVPQGLGRILDRALAKQVEDRYATAEEMAFDLQVLAEERKHERLDTLLETARRLVDEHQLVSARTVLLQAQRIDPGNLGLKTLLGDVQERLNQAQRGEQAFQTHDVPQSLQRDQARLPHEQPRKTGERTRGSPSRESEVKPQTRQSTGRENIANLQDGATRELQIAHEETPLLQVLARTEQLGLDAHPVARQALPEDPSLAPEIGEEGPLEGEARAQSRTQILQPLREVEAGFKRGVSQGIRASVEPDPPRQNETAPPAQAPMELEDADSDGKTRHLPIVRGDRVTEDLNTSAPQKGVGDTVQRPSSTPQDDVFSAQTEYRNQILTGGGFPRQPQGKDKDSALSVVIAESAKKAAMGAIGTDQSISHILGAAKQYDESSATRDAGKKRESKRGRKANEARGLAAGDVGESAGKNSTALPEQMPEHLEESLSRATDSVGPAMKRPKSPQPGADSRMWAAAPGIEGAAFRSRRTRRWVGGGIAAAVLMGAMLVRTWSPSKRHFDPVLELSPAAPEVSIAPVTPALDIEIDASPWARVLEVKDEVGTRMALGEEKRVTPMRLDGVSAGTYQVILQGGDGRQRTVECKVAAESHLCTVDLGTPDFKQVLKGEQP